MTDIDSMRLARQRDAERTPLRLYGQLFIDVQMNRVFGDGKTFVDATPKHLTPHALCALYERDRQLASFSLHDFVRRHFALPHEVSPRGPQGGIREHIRSLWPQLLRRTPDMLDPPNAPPEHRPDDAADRRGLLRRLPHRRGFAG